MRGNGKGTEEVRWVGIDGGASNVRAVAIGVDRTGLLRTEGETFRRALPPRDGFTPLSVPRQLAEREAPVLDSAEQRRAERIVETVAEVVHAAAGRGDLPLAIGVCMPGLPEPGGRGVAVLRHGARLPRFLDRLETRLTEGGIRLARPAGPLVADSHAAGWGEEFAVDGRLRNVENALYLAGGTGVAEMVKLEGGFPSPAELSRLLPSAWKIRSETGATFEDRVSMAAIHAAWSARSATRDVFVEARAALGDEVAGDVLCEAAEALAELLHLRLASLRRDRDALLERIVLGQRTGVLFSTAALANCFADPLRNALARRLRESDDAAMREAYLVEAELREDLLVASPLFAAPAIGAVAAALGIVDSGPREGDG